MGRGEITAGVCDDELEDLKRICQEFARCVRLLGEKDPIFHTCQNGQEMLESCQKDKLDLVFLDLEMPGWNGFELAGQLHRLDSSIKIIFVSNHENMVFDSYEYAPLWFVRKSSLERDMPKAVKKYFQMAAKIQIHCRTKEGMYDLWVYINEVLYIEGSGHTLFMKLLNKECHQLYGSLKPLEERFSSHGFVRIHKNYLVNAKYVKEIGRRTVFLADGTELDIGKNRRKKIIELVKSSQHGGRLC